MTLRGRRIPVAVRTWRERVLAEAESASRRHDGPVEVRATLPGLVVAVAVKEGDEVAVGRDAAHHRGDEDAERGPRAAGGTGGGDLAVVAGQAVAAGPPLLRIE